MLSGKQKAQLLLALLADQSQEVLEHLSQESAALLTASIDDAPQVTAKSVHELLTELRNKIEHLKEATVAPPAPEIIEPEVAPEPEPAPVEALAPAVEEAPEPETYSNLRQSREIADVLSQQKPQVVAFMLTRTKKPLRDEIIGYLPSDLVEKIQTSDVEAIPIGDRVYEKLHKAIFEK